MKKLLWIGDAGVDSGFARVTHSTLDRLHGRGYECAVLAINYLGDPHSYPYRLYPAWPGKDALGIGRLSEVVIKERPDVIVIQNDPWYMRRYMSQLEGANIPVVGVISINGKNCKTAKDLNALNACVFWTEFGLNEARKGGFVGPGYVAPLGVDRDIYHPLDRMYARRSLGLPFEESDFVFLNVNRNQARKRLDLTITYFLEWLCESKVENAYLMLHAAPTGDKALDLKQFADYMVRELGAPERRILVSQPEARKGLEQTDVAALYNAADVLISTSQSEGFSLPTLEAMACGTPCIVPHYAALAEWPKGAVDTVPCDHQMSMFSGINVLEAAPSKRPFIDAMQRLYEDAEYRAQRGLDAYARASDSEFSWDTWSNTIDRVIKEHC